MRSSSWTPRTLALAAATGLTLAASPGCKCSEEEPAPQAAAPSASTMVAAESGNKDCCIGKNDCKGKGGCGVPESHACAGQNECKGKGGCSMHCPK